MTVSARFLPHIALLAVLAGAVVWPAWLSPRRTDPCAHPDVLPVTGLIPGSRPEGERRDRLGGDIVQWSEGRVTDPGLAGESPLFFRMIRTYNVLKMAQRPLSLMPTPVEPETVRVELVEAPGGPLPIHVVRTTRAAGFYVAAYLYLYGNDPVPHPFGYQLRGALRELREGRRPLTLILVGGPAIRENAAKREDLALRWIVSAWQHYRSMCHVRTGGPSP
jgi:hypothetical protein